MVIDRILAIRDQPPLNRVPGPVTIKYYLHEQEKEEPLDCFLPTSTSTIWRILDENQRIYRSQPGEIEPLPAAEPMEIWQIDFKDVTTVRRLEEAIKKQHFVETLNIIDTGTSILVDNPARSDFNAETSIRSIAHVLQAVGCPRQITFDRDPRFVASASSGDFQPPSSVSWPVLGSKLISVRRNALTAMALLNATTEPTSMKPS